MAGTTKEQDEWLRDFTAFLTMNAESVPETVSESVLSFVRAELNPPIRQWGSKFLCIHVVTGLLFLAVCPQLGVGPFVGDLGLGHFFMSFGKLPCAALCGAIFLGLTSGAATILLNREELRVANRHKVLNICFLTALSFVAIILAGGNSERLEYFAWLCGATITGSLVLWLGVKLRLETRPWSRPAMF